MLNPEHVFEAVRRGYNDLENANRSEITSYFEELPQENLEGHINNIKGILFEQEYVDQLATEGIKAQVFEATNHPIVDIAVFEGDEIVNELQLKATDSVSYINDTLANQPGLEIVATTEVAQDIKSDMVIDSGIENEVLEEAVTDTLLEEAAGSVFDEAINPISPISILRELIGLPF